MWPESVFEEQLRARLGAVPAWLSSRADSFEAITRYSQIDIDSPFGDTALREGEQLSVSVRLHPKFDRGQMARVRLHAARGHDLDVEEVIVAESSDQNVKALSWTPSATGAWRIRLVLVNSLGEETTSEPVYIFVQPLEASVTYAKPADAWLQPRSLDHHGISQASAKIVYLNAAQYGSAVRAREKPLVRNTVNDYANRRVANRLIDNLSYSVATGPAGLRWWGVKGFVFDLGSHQPIHFVELVAPQDMGPGKDSFGAFYVQVSDDPEPQYSYTNSDFAWRTVRRMGNARNTGRIRFDSNGRSRIYLPTDTQARFVRLVIHTLDSRYTHEGNLSEVRFGTFTGM